MDRDGSGDDSTPGTPVERPDHVYGVDGGESPTAAVVAAVVEAGERDATDLPPLHDAVEPEGLDVPFGRRGNESARVDSRLVFSFAGCVVVVEHDVVYVREHR